MEATKIRKLVLAAAAVAVVALAAAGLIWLLGGVGKNIEAKGTGGRVTIAQKKELPASGIQRVEVDAVSSTVIIGASPDSLVHAELSGYFAGNPDSAPRLVADTKGDRIQVRVEHKPFPIGALAFDTTLKVDLPRDYSRQLRVTTVSGEIQVPDWTFTALEVHTTSGGVAVGEVKADTLAVSSVSGEIAVKGADAASVELKSTSGEIKAAGLRGQVKSSTVSGGVSLTWSSFAGNAEIATTSGEVLALLPAESGFVLDAGSVSGNIACDFPLTISDGSEAGRHGMKGTIGAGTGTLYIRTTSGDIRVSKE